MFSYIMLKTNYQPHALTFDYQFMEMQSYTHCGRNEDVA